MADSSQAKDRQLRSREIMEDTEIFPKFYRELCGKAIASSPQFKIRLVKTYRPQVKEIVNKYGNEDRKISGRLQDYFSFTLDEREDIDQIIVYHYDNYGFVTQKDDPSRYIVFIFWSENGLHKPHSMEK